MKRILLEDIKRISSLMYGKENLISERFSNKTTSYFSQYGFIPGVFHYGGVYDTDQFFSVIKSTFKNAISFMNFDFVLSVENYEGDSPDAYQIDGGEKIRAIVVAKDPSTTPKANEKTNVTPERNPSIWETYVLLSKSEFDQAKVNEVIGNFPKLKLNPNGHGDARYVFSLGGSMTKEEVVQVRDYIKQPDWTGTSSTTPNNTNQA